jgi:adenosylcobinamide-GDP ribazoletransferase
MGARTVSGFRSAASLLTRIPVGGRADNRDVGRALPWFPVVGALVGLAVAAVYGIARSIVPSTLAAAIAVGGAVIATGALHEDGLADTADAFFGGRTLDDRLRIMRDPTHGTYGMLAIVLSVVTRVAAIGAISATSAVLVVPTAFALARTGAAALLMVRPARNDGLGATYSLDARPRQVRAAGVVAVVIAIAGFGPWAPAAVGEVAAVAGFVGLTSIRRIHGITGDVLGAAEQLGEIVVLVLGAALIHHGVIVAPWWRG